MREPVKYEKTNAGHWVITPAWKEWAKKNRQKQATKKETKPKNTKEPITAENHKYVWKEVARSFGSEKRIFFCICLSKIGKYNATCGSVGVQQTRSGKIEVVIEPRFE